MSISKYPSKVTLPESAPGCITVLDYLVLKFPLIGANTWRRRMNTGKVHDTAGTAIGPDRLFTAKLGVYYYREVTEEPVIPFDEAIIFEDDTLLLAYKPHFLPVTAGGRYVNQCLQNRLRQSTGNDQLQALHRLDRLTAGLVLFAKKEQHRALYHQLFEHHNIEKHYQAVSEIDPCVNYVGRQWQVENHICRGEPRFLMRIGEGDNNSCSLIRCIGQHHNKALFELQPITGKTHQLRLHMQSIGLPILNDPLYPVLQPEQPQDFSRPLQLLARRLTFTDPVTQQQRDFRYHAELGLE